MMKEVRRLKSLKEFHRSRGLPPPQHPLISVVDYAAVQLTSENNSVSWVFDFYSIALKRNLVGGLTYGQQEYDFDEGVMFFIAPGQVFSIQVAENQTNKSGWILLAHPDFFWNTPLAKVIKKYEFFDYAVNEALFLSPKEEAILNSIAQNIELEHRANIDEFSQAIIISQLETLLNYAERFYRRQFITRKITNHQILERLEDLLSGYFRSQDIASTGLPSVQYVADQLNLSSNYLTTLLKVLTGKSTQHHIHDKLIEIAKEKLSTTDLTVNEIAFELGFERSQSFSKLFKNKTNQSPLEFRKSFQ